MPATYTDNGNTPNGSQLVFTYTFPALQTEDVKVALNGATQATTKYTVDNTSSPTKITFNNTSIDSNVQESSGAPKTGVTVRVFRETTVGKSTGDEDPKAVFAAGSSVRASDLNNNQEQVCFGIHELQEQPFVSSDIEDGAITSAKIQDGTIVNVDINASAAIAGTKVSPNFGSQAVSTSGTLAAGATTVTGNITVSGTVDGRDVAADGSKLDGVANSANNYTHPTHPGDDFSVDTGALTGAVVVSDVDINVTTDGSGHVTDANGSVSTRTLTLANLGYTGDTDAKNDQTASEIKTLLNSDKLTNSQIADNTVGPDQLAHTSVTAGSYGSSTSIPSLTVDAQGRVTAASGNSVNFDVVADTTPQLGGNLDVNGQDIVSTSNGDIELDPNGSGKVVFKGNATKGAGQFKLNCENNSHAITIKGPPHSAAASYTLTLPNNDGDSGQYLKTDGVGNLSWDTVSGGGGGSGTAAPNNIVTFTGNIDGSNKTYALSVTPDSAQNLIVSLNGVVQKPNAGTSIANSAEGYCISGSNLIFATAPASGSTMFVTELSATVAGDSITEGNSKVDVFDDNATAHVKIELDGAEKFRVYQNGEIGLGGANYGSSGQFLKSQGSGSPAVWATPTDTNTQLSTEEVQDIVGGMVSSNTETNITVTYDDTNGKLNFVSTDTNTQVGGATGVDFNDDVYIRLGTGNDLKIWHNAGGDSYIRNESGNLLIEANGSGDDAIKIVPDGAVELYYNNVKTLNTEANGIIVRGPEGGDGILQILADEGDDNADFWRLFSSSSSSEFRIQNINNGSSWENNIKCFGDGAVELYYDGTKKFETDANGVTITGQCALTSHAAWPDHTSGYVGKAVFGAGDDLQIYHDGTNSFIENNTGQLRIKTDSLSLRGDTSGESYLVATYGGSVELYYDNTKKLETTSQGLQINGYTSIEANTSLSYFIEAHQTGSGNGCQIRFRNDHEDNCYVGLKGDTTGDFRIYNEGKIRLEHGADQALVSNQDGAVELYYDGDKKFETTPTGAKVISTAHDSGLEVLAANNNQETRIKIQGKSSAGVDHDWILGASRSSDKFFITNGSTTCLAIHDSTVVQVMSERLTLGTSITNGGAGDGNFVVEFSSETRNAVKLRDTYNTGSTTYMVLVGGSTTVGSITGTTGAASFNNLSDYRSKENDVEITDGITKLKLLRPIRFNYKTDSSTLYDGFFAHEVTPAVPTAVTGVKDAVDSEGKIDPQMLDASKLVPLLTAALQEAITKIETLETKVAALEAK